MTHSWRVSVLRFLVPESERGEGHFHFWSRTIRKVEVFFTEEAYNDEHHSTWCEKKVERGMLHHCQGGRRKGISSDGMDMEG